MWKHIQIIEQLGLFPRSSKCLGWGSFADTYLPWVTGKTQSKKHSLFKCDKYLWQNQTCLPACKYSRFSIPDFGLSRSEYGRI